MDMFENLYKQVPLATKMRPTSLDNYVGQNHILSPGMPLYEAIQSGKLHSMIFWGPPGVGKTTLAQIIANKAKAQFINLSAVMSGIKDIRQAVVQATQAQQPTILFIDEVHRFNKSQQDAFLPYVEDGTFTFIGATTENPSFEVNNALLSRARVYVLKPLEEPDLQQVISKALADPINGLGHLSIDMPFPIRNKLIQAADGDARRLLNYLSLLVDFSPPNETKITITEALLNRVISNTLRQFDKGGDNFYDQISALHKSVRGSSPDGALYWLARMLDGGCDPLYIARRVVRMASEDIGNADPRGLQLALNAWDTQQRLGSPEGELAIAQAVTYLACAPKSNAVYTAFKAAMADVKKQGSLPVPKHLRNAPTALMKAMEHGKDYRYDHDEANAIASGQTYFPEQVGEQQYYYPSDRGLEIKIKEKLEKIRS